MSVHVAIVDRRYVQPILTGRKTVECRLTRTARPPFGCVTPGEQIFLKRSGGAYFAKATVIAVYEVADLTPTAVDAIRKSHDRQIRGDANFWQSRRGVARYATLIWLKDVCPIEAGPTYARRHMVAWYVLDDAAATAEGDDAPAAVEVPLTDGAVRNGYVALGQAASALGGATAAGPARAVHLHLDQGPAIETEVLANGRLRWRGWGRWFARCGIRGGDRLRFVPLTSPGHFRVVADTNERK